MERESPKQMLVRQVYYSQDLGTTERIPKFLLEDMFDIFIDNIKSALVTGEKVYLRGFGTFSPIRDNFVRRHMYSPGAGKEVDVIILNHYKIFKPSRSLIRKINVGTSDVFERYFKGSDNT